MAEAAEPPEMSVTALDPESPEPSAEGLPFAFPSWTLFAPRLYYCLLMDYPFALPSELCLLSIDPCLFYGLFFCLALPISVF